MPGTPPVFVQGAMVGGLLAGGVEESALIGLLVPGETAQLATGGESGSALFTSARVLIAERVGILSKRLAVKAIRRDAIVAYTIDPDTLVTLTLQGGSFGTANLFFDNGFDPMHLSTWLGETLVRPQIEDPS